MTDVGLLVYWLAVALGLIPAEYAFNGYESPVMRDWNWSFFPLDVLAAGAGLAGAYLLARGRPEGPAVTVVSLALTFCAGLMAISFWWLSGDVTLSWWLPNLYLMGMPVYFALVSMVARRAAARGASPVE
ncbi:DUF5360 family protein [Cellulomonas hominis]|uniref:DUF5360 family protein n=1 Tax=Cellulomonas hominis TaxID=156981 RepID=UPI001BCC9D6E|nr:DUF5360 family protein [Cellulomonas hominis]